MQVTPTKTTLPHEAMSPLSTIENKNKKNSATEKIAELRQVLVITLRSAVCAPAVQCVFKEQHTLLVPNVFKGN